MSKELPALNWLGYSLNMTTVTPLNIKAVSEAVLKGRQILDVDPYANIRQVEINGIKYDVPRSVAVDPTGTLQSNFSTYPDGTSVSKAFKEDTSVSVGYLAVQGGESASYAIDKTFRSDNQFAFFSFNNDTYRASLRNFLSLINESDLVKGINALPKPFESSNETVREYKDFFSTWGTHIITGTTYGARFQLTIWTSNKITEYNNFPANVIAAFNGIPQNGNYDASIMTTAQFQTFLNNMQKLVAVQGGDLDLAIEIGSDPTKYDEYSQWTKTVNTRSDLMNFQTVELWTLMKQAIDPDIKMWANTIHDAYNWIVEHPQVYSTAALLHIESDWAEFGLLSPSAVIIPDPKVPFPDPTNTFFNSTKVTWGKEHSHVEKRMSINFLVINDGSPIDFYISHGTDGSTSGKGLGQLTMEGTTYINNKVHDDNWNTQFFYQATVSTNPAPSKGRSANIPRSWDSTLKEYLHRIKADA